MRLSTVSLLTTAVALAVATAQAAQQATPTAPTTPPALGGQRRVPFGVGEVLQYEVRFGPLRVGRGSMEVTHVETVRGRPTWRTLFQVKGGTFFYHVEDRFESWIDTLTLSSLRHVQDINEGSRDRERHFEIFPERQTYLEMEEQKAEQPSVAEPLDDGSFLYFIRTVPLEVGQTYTFQRYFRPDRNPVKITVLRRERVKVPAGEFDAIVISPSIKTKGIFSENGHAELWLSDDANRIILQMKSQLKIGSLNLYLKSFRPAAAAETEAATTSP